MWLRVRSENAAVSGSSSVDAAVVVGLCDWNLAPEPMVLGTRPRAGNGGKASVGTHSLGSQLELLLETDIRTIALGETMLSEECVSRV